MTAATMDLHRAREAGEAGMQRALSAAESRDPVFAEKAREAILRHLKAVGKAGGEELTDTAHAMGVQTKNPKAFGAVLKGLAREKLIERIGFVPRMRGHGAPGPLWEITAKGRAHQ